MWFVSDLPRSNNTSHNIHKYSHACITTIFFFLHVSASAYSTSSMVLPFFGTFCFSSTPLIFFPMEKTDFELLYIVQHNLCHGKPLLQRHRLGDIQLSKGIPWQLYQPVDMVAMASGRESAVYLGGGSRISPAGSPA